MDSNDGTNQNHAVEGVKHAWSASLTERENVKDVGVDGRIKLKVILRKWGRREWNLYFE